MAVRIGVALGCAIRNQLHPVECLAVTPQREFAIGPVGRVVVGVARHLGIGHGLKVECRS